MVPGEAVCVLPTCSVPLMVGAPVAGVLGVCALACSGAPIASTARPASTDPSAWRPRDRSCPRREGTARWERSAPPLPRPAKDAVGSPAAMPSGSEAHSILRAVMTGKRRWQPAPSWPRPGLRPSCGAASARQVRGCCFPAMSPGSDPTKDSLLSPIPPTSRWSSVPRAPRRPSRSPKPSTLPARLPWVRYMA